jgi:AsmA protein
MRVLLKAIGWLVKFTLAVVLLLVAASAIIIALEIKVELDALRTPVALAASGALDREVRLDGSISLVPTLWPTVEINDVSVGNPDGWPDDKPLAKLDLVRLKLGVMQLLSGKLYVAEATAEGVTLNLVSNANGDNNWEFGDKETADDAGDTDADSEPTIRLTSIEDLDLSDIALHFRDEKLGKDISFRLARMQGNVVEGEPFSLTFNGDLEGKAYQFEFTGGSLTDLRDKKVNWPVKLDGTLVDTPVTLEGEVVREGKNQLKAGLKVGKVDLGATLAWLKVVDGMRMTVGGLTADLLLQGSDLSELLQQARIAIVLKDGQWDLQSRDKQSSLPLRVKTSKVSVEPGKPLRIMLDALADETPVAIRITGSTLLDYTHEGKKLPLVVNLKLGGADITLSTRVARPIDTTNLTLQLEARGDKIDGFDPLLGTDLPPLGPYSIKGGFALTPKGYEIHQLLLTIGDSQLAGEFALDAIARPYRLDVNLHSKRLQLDDFDTGDWTSQDTGKAKQKAEQSTQAGDQQQAAGQATKQGAENTKKLRKLLSYEALSKINAKIEVKVDQVLSGADKPYVHWTKY